MAVLVEGKQVSSQDLVLAALALLRLGLFWVTLRFLIGLTLLDRTVNVGS